MSGLNGGGGRVKRSDVVALDVSRQRLFGFQLFEKVHQPFRRAGAGIVLKSGNSPRSEIRIDETKHSDSVFVVRAGEESQGKAKVLIGRAAALDPQPAWNGRVVVNGEEYQAKNIIIATGSAPRGLPIEGADLAMTSDDILAMETLPKSLCIVGGGVIGMEFAAVFSTFGVEVTVIEYCKEILPPFDKDVAKRLKTVLSKRGIKIITSAAVNGITKGEDGLTVTYELKGKPQSVTCEKVLMSVGRQPVLPQGLDAVGVTVGRRGIEVDDNMMTNVKGVYAIGDVNGRMMLAHAASAQGQRALNAILGKADEIKLDIVPSAVFTVPELAMVGLTEEQCAEKGLDVTVKKSFFRSNGKAVAMNETDGLIKMIVDNATRQIVGCHICGAHAADLIQEVVTAMNAGATVDLLSRSIHGHPTLSEVMLTAARQF